MGLARWLPISALLFGPGCRQVLGLDDLKCTPAYTAPAEYDTGNSPRAVTVADLTVDGFLDVITANNASANVSRLFSNGDGTLAAKSDHGALAFPQTLAAGDVTGDGVPDVVVRSNDGFMVMRGDGTAVGGLTPDPTTLVGAIRDIAIADINRDGIDDVVAATDANSAGHSMVFLGQATSPFPAPADFGGPVGAAFVRIADFNGDAILDLLIAERTGTRPLVMLPGVGDGTFGARIDSVAAAPVSTLVVGDLTADGVADLVIGSTDALPTRVTAMIANGDGTFAPGTPADSLLVPHHLADIDLDGNLDLLSWSFVNLDGVESPNIGVQYGHGDGGFDTLGAAHTLSVAPVAITAANIDGDEIIELIAVLGTNKVAIVDGSCSYD